MNLWGSVFFATQSQRKLKLKNKLIVVSNSGGLTRYLNLTNEKSINIVLTFSRQVDLKNAFCFVLTTNKF